MRIGIARSKRAVSRTDRYRNLSGTGGPGNGDAAFGAFRHSGCLSAARKSQSRFNRGESKRKKCRSDRREGSCERDQCESAVGETKDWTSARRWRQDTGYPFAVSGRERHAFDCRRLCRSDSWHRGIHCYLAPGKLEHGRECRCCGACGLFLRPGGNQLRLLSCAESCLS